MEAGTPITMPWRRSAKLGRREHPDARRPHVRDLAPRRGLLPLPVRAGGPLPGLGAVWAFGITLFVFGIAAVVLFARLLWEAAS
jgi:hypothetical protein